MTNLFPCPKCCRDTVSMNCCNMDDLPNKRFRFVCDCGLIYETYPPSADFNEAEKEAIEAWNKRAERTRKLKWKLQGETQTQEFWCCECGNCGECFGVEDRRSFPFKITINKVDIPNYCPNCGTRVRSEA